VVGAVDGSCIPLSFCPSICGGDYFDRYFIPKPLIVNITPVFFLLTLSFRKSNYSINVQFVVDPDARVRYWFGGVPGSTHDSRCTTYSTFMLLFRYNNTFFLFGCCAVHFDNHECRYGRMNILVKASIC
jgi:hypothetical protein